MRLGEQLARRFARLTTNVVVRQPRLWRAFRRVLGWQFDRLAPRWESLRGPENLLPFRAALERLARAPARALDVGTGTGAGAFAVAERFPETSVVGVDVAPRMLEQARRMTPPALAGRVSFRQADAARLPFEAEAFDLVTLANMIPFFDELERVVAPGGYLAIAYSSGPQTPIYVSPERLRRELAARGFAEFEEVAAGNGTALLARRRDRA